MVPAAYLEDGELGRRLDRRRRKVGEGAAGPNRHCFYEPPEGGESTALNFKKYIPPVGFSLNRGP